MTAFYSSLAEQLNTRATRAVLGLKGFRNDPLREYLREYLEQPAGLPGSFLADPVFEATFGWQPSEKSLADLAGQVLHPDAIRALAEPFKAFRAEYEFPRDRHPYQHQLEAWQALLDDEVVRSVLVTSGTGSGKTECFLVPILSDLAREIAEGAGAPLTGVRALFLYPLNALIKSQKDRLVAWSEPFEGKVRFCLYNGSTKEQVAANQWEYNSEVLDRKTLRANPPPILVTNATMLEYMLVRQKDRPILDQSQGLLRWIVIDEAHTYIGSQAAELTLLLRRVIHAFGVQPGQVHFVATSATLGTSGEENRRRLAEFLADIAGVPLTQVTVVEGRRQIPELPAELCRYNQPHPGFDALRQMSAAERFEALGRDDRIRQLRNAIIEKPRTLTDLTAQLYPESSSVPDHRRHTLELLDLCTQAQDQQAFLPLRGHFFQRTVNGLWACINIGCNGKADTRLANAAWPFGAVYLERHAHCPSCHYPVFEVVQCEVCGAEYLAVIEVYRQNRDWLVAWSDEREEDDYQQGIELPTDEDEEETNQLPATSREGLPRLLTHPNQANALGYLLPDGQLVQTSDKGVRVEGIIAETPLDGMRCGVCRAKDGDRQAFSRFRPVRVGAPFLLDTAIPTLFNYVKPFEADGTSRPLDGRRLITFTDSRQGNARSATRLQQGSERDYVRSVLYHSVAANVPMIDPQRIIQLENRITALIPIAPTDSELQGLLDDCRQELNKLQNPVAHSVSWVDAIDKLLATDHFTRFVLPGFRETIPAQLLDNRAIAHLCLLREFFVRPPRQPSLENLGLLQLTYPALQQSPVPSIMQQKGVSQAEWQSLLSIAVDYVVRGSGPCITESRDFTRWLGYPGRPMYLLRPGYQHPPTPIQRRWPTAQYSNRMVRLLAFAFNLDIQNHAEHLDELLNAVWVGISRLLQPEENGDYRLNLQNHAHISQVREVWFCPITRRLLPNTFRGITPYLTNSAPEQMFQCQSYSMPKIPVPFWAGIATDEVENWLNTDPCITELRNIGAWINVSDRIARNSRYFRTVEHSAQIDGGALSIRENQFKNGKINLMSCSTTMEMGVDIGGLTGVAMNNVPPHPANFLQRAGRAGRRGETAAFSFTLCKNTPHGEAVFRNPLWPFVTRLALPRVEMRSAPIVQRHINALLLTEFLRERGGNEQLYTLSSGWFFESAHPDVSAPCDTFMDWCKQEACQVERLIEGIATIIRKTLLEGVAISELLQRTADALQNTANHWRANIELLLEQLATVQTQNGNSGAERGLKYQLNRIRGEYLLGELAQRGFLPGYGFPTDVVPLINRTLADLPRNQNNQPNPQNQNEGNPTRTAGYPSRNLAIAIRDYAPGTDTVVDQRVYRSGGVTLNWHIPANMEAITEIQSLRYFWHCRDCGNSGTRALWPEKCPVCESENLGRHRFLRPAGFAVDIRHTPHNDVSRPQYIPVIEPVLSLTGVEWMNLSRVGRYRSSTEGHIYQYSKGLQGLGYALCLVCGKADSMTEREMLPASFLDDPDNQATRTHKRLRGGRENDQETRCPGNEHNWSIQLGLHLGVETWTDVLELQLTSPQGEPLTDETTAYTLAVALRRVLCGELGIEEREIGCVAASSRSVKGQGTQSIYLYDTLSGGAGYASQAAALLPELLRKARDAALQCPAECDDACQCCLLDYQTQHHQDDLNRHKALEWLSDDFLNALSLPSEWRVLGTGTQIELETLVLALRREWQRQPGTELRIYLGGDASEWEPLMWRLQPELQRLSHSGLQLILLLPKNRVEQLDMGQRSELQALAAVTRVRFRALPAEGVNIGSLWLAMELVRDNQDAVRWAATHTLSPNANWGSGEGEVRYVVCQNQPPYSMENYPEIASETFRPVIHEGTTTLEIKQELDGNSIGFGNRVWALIAGKVPELNARLQGTTPLTRVEYTDRYLRSPLVLHLVHSLLDGLGQYTGGKHPDTLTQIQTSQHECRDERFPSLIQHDWRDALDRSEVAQAFFGVNAWQESSLRELPHARELKLIWPDITWVIRLDQGVGYWEIQPHVRQRFSFDRDKDKQINEIRSLNLMIQANRGGHPTYWYCQKTG